MHRVPRTKKNITQQHGGSDSKNKNKSVKINARAICSVLTFRPTRTRGGPRPNKLCYQIFSENVTVLCLPRSQASLSLAAKVVGAQGRKGRGKEERRVSPLFSPFPVIPRVLVPSFSWFDFASFRLKSKRLRRQVAMSS